MTLVKTLGSEKQGLPMVEIRVRKGRIRVLQIRH